MIVRKNGYAKVDGGASLLEVVLVLGIMAVITPVVMKFAFSDLADVRYLNIANQLKQFTKAAMAFAASKRSEWKNGEVGEFTAREFTDILEEAGLKESVDEKMLDNSKFRYIKSADVEKEGEEGSLVAYLLVDMSEFGLSFANFRKTLLFVGDNVGYVTDETCGTCVNSGRCVCGINGEWADTYYNASGIQGSSGNAVKGAVSFVGDERGMNEELTAVIRIDDNMLEKEYLSDYYLYRNSQGGADGNVMYRDFSLGGHSIKNLRDIDAQVLASPTAGAVPYLNADTALFHGDVAVSGSMFFGEEDKFEKLTFVGGARMIAERINFLADNFFDAVSFENAVLMQSQLLKSNSPVINVAGEVKFPVGATLQVQTATFRGIKDSSFKVNEEAFSGSIGSVDSVSSNMKFRVPNLNMKNLDVKVLTVGQNVVSKNGETVVSTNGSLNSSGNVILHNILGQSKQVDIFGKLANFQTQSSALKASIVAKYAASYNSGEGG